MPNYYNLGTFRGGISDENDKGIAGSFKHGQALDIHKRFDSLTSKQAMATIFGAANTTMTGLIQYFVPASDGTLYCFSNVGSIFARSGDGAWNFVYNDENGNIKGASEWKLSTGTNYLFWATNTSVARKELQGADVAPDSGSARWTDATQDWKTTLNSADWHPLRPATGSLCIGNANSLSTVDFDGNFNASNLNLRPGNIIKCLEEKDDYVIIGSGRVDGGEEGHIWSWISTATNWVQKKRIPVKGVNALINAEQFILQGGDDGELFFSDFVNAVPIHSIPGGGQVSPGGVSIENDLAVFGLYGGTYPGIWSYGRRNKNRPQVLNYDYRLSPTVSGSTVSSVGAIVVIDNSTLLAAWGTTDGSTSDYGVDSVSSTTKATGDFQGLEFDNQMPWFKKRFNLVRLTMTPLPSGTSVSVKFKGDNETAWRYAVVGDGSTTYSAINATEAEFSINKPAQIFEVGVELNPSSNSSPEILAISTEIADEGYQHG